MCYSHPGLRSSKPTKVKVIQSHPGSRSSKAIQNQGHPKPSRVKVIQSQIHLKPSKIKVTQNHQRPKFHLKLTAMGDNKIFVFLGIPMGYIGTHPLLLTSFILQLGQFTSFSPSSHKLSNYQV